MLVCQLPRGLDARALAGEVPGTWWLGVRGGSRGVRGAPSVEKQN